MLASKDEYLQEASETIYRMSADDLVRKRCRDREEYYQDLRNYERKIEQDRLEHEQDRLAYEEDKRNYEHKIEQDRRNYERIVAEKEEEIRKLRAQLARKEE